MGAQLVSYMLPLMPGIVDEVIGRARGSRWGRVSRVLRDR